MHEDIRRYAEWGYHLVPWINRNGSSPRPLIKGWSSSAPSMQSVEAFADRWPDCDWAIVPSGAVVLDLENKNGKNGVNDLTLLCSENDTSFEDLVKGCPISKTPNDGRHIWFALPDGVNLKGGFYIADGVEVKATNGSAHVPPSVGRSWIQPMVAPGELPVVPEWLMRLLSAGGKMHRQAASTTVATIGKGHRRSWLLSCAGKIRQEFAASRIELAMILKTLRDSRCDEPETMLDSDIDKIADDYARMDCTNTHALAIAGDPIAQCAIRLFSTAVPRIAEIDAESEPEEPESPFLSAKFCKSTPMLAQWMDWYKGCSVIYQPEMALAAMMSTISLMIGRDLTWRDSKCNLYTICLGTTGVGKEAVKRAMLDILQYVGLRHLVGASSFASDAGMFREISVSPELMWVNDEFQTFVSLLAMPNAPPYVKSIERLLTEGFTGNISGRSLKAETTADVLDPHPVVIALTQPETFWKSMTPRMIESGFIGRFVMVSARQLSDAADGGARRILPPKSLVDLIKSGLVGKTELTARAAAGKNASPIEMQSTPEAETLFAELKRKDREARAALPSESIEAKMAARRIEKIMRVTMCHAWSKRPIDPVIDADSLRWATHFVDYCNRRTVASMESNASANPYEHSLKLMRTAIASTRQFGLKKSDLIAKTTHLGGGVRDDIIASLLASNQIYEIRHHNGRGRPSTTYIAKEHYVESES